jgi:hypothetical protein
MAKTTEDVKGKLTGEDGEPFEGDVPIVDVEKEIQSMI